MGNSDPPKPIRRRFSSRWRAPLIVLAVIAVLVLGVYGLRRQARVAEYRAARSRMASQIADIKAGETDTLTAIDPRFIDNLFEDPECVAKVRKLDLIWGDVSDERFGRLKGLPNVQEITFYDISGADVFLKRIRGMPSVESMSFSGMGLGEEGVRHLGSFPNLKSLSFGQTHLTDAELLQLGNLAQLERLHIGNTTQVSDEGIEKLRQALSNCKIEH